MPFELFKKNLYRNRHVGTNPRLSINSRGMIIFGVVFSRKFIQCNKYVKVYIDRERRLIGFNFVNSCVDNIQKITMRRSSRMISAKSVLDCLNFSFKDTTRFYANEEDTEHGKLIVIDCSKKVE